MQDTAVNRIARLNWVSGFGGGPHLRFRAHLTTIGRLANSSPGERVRECDYVPALPDERRNAWHDFELTSMAALRSGDCFRVGPRKLAPFGLNFADPDRAPLRRQRALIRVSDENTALLTFSEIEELDAELCAAIESYAPCPPDLCFYVLWSDCDTVAFPCSAILKTCYAPNTVTLRNYLTAVVRERYASTDVTFDGFCFVRLGHDDLRVYWYRARRDLSRAEHEISQLMPRSAAYAALHGGEMPFMLRLPFSGSASVSGEAIVVNGSRRISVFLEDICFEPACTPSRLRSIGSDQLAFAPYRNRDGTSLTAGFGIIFWRGDIENEVFEPRFFPKVLDDVKYAVSLGLIAPEFAAMSCDEITDVHRICLRGFLPKTIRRLGTSSAWKG